MPTTATDAVEPFYWDQYRDTSIGRYLFQREHAFIRRALGGATRAWRLLDVGCGSGRLTLPLREAGHDVVGVDLSRSALASFRRQSTTAPAVMGDARCLPFADASFDGVIAIQSFDYIDHVRFLAECRRVLRGEGLLVFDALNRRSYKWLLKRRVGRSLVLPSANMDCREVLRATAESGFEIEAVRGYNWLPFTRHSDSKMVGLAALAERVLGLDRHYRLSPKILVAARKGGRRASHLR
ncbi:MAG TPA: methyltransferase domain-containing protein [Chloroflexota bacterium]|jgi:ubiquinone/menaquinone biosynthesis C-methylase UbiE